MLRELLRAVRMDAEGFPVDDSLLLLVRRAQDAVEHLHVELH